MKVKMKSFSHVQLFVTPWAVAYQAPPSMGFSRTEYCSGYAMASSRGFSQSRDRTFISYVSCTGGATWEVKLPCIELKSVFTKLSFFSWFFPFEIHKDLPGIPQDRPHVFQGRFFDYPSNEGSLFFPSHPPLDG